MFDQRNTRTAADDSDRSAPIPMDGNELNSMTNAHRKRPAGRIGFRLCLCALALTVGCAPRGERDTSGAERILADLRKSYESTPNLSMEGTLIISGAPVTIWFDAIIKRRDSLKIVMNGPFGIPVGAMGATPGHFVFLNLQESAALEGTPDRETFEELLQIGLNYDEIIALLRGELPTFPEPGTFSTELRDDLIVYTANAGNRVERFSIDPSTSTVKDYARSRVFPDTTIEEITISYRNFKPLGDRQLARRVQVSLAGGTQTMQVNIEEARTRIPDDESIAIDIPPGITRKRL